MVVSKMETVGWRSTLNRQKVGKMELNEYWSAQAVAEYKGMLHEQKMQNYVFQCERTAPHVIHDVKIMKDGNKWCCILGDFSTGVVGFGNSPKDACDEFDRVWNKSLISESEDLND